jgi:hypothetical protein
MHPKRLVIAFVVPALAFAACDKLERPRTTPGEGSGIYNNAGGALANVINNPTQTSNTATSNSVVVTAASSTTSAASVSATTSATTAAGSGLCSGILCPAEDKCITNINGSFCTDGSSGAPCASNGDCRSGICPPASLACM